MTQSNTNTGSQPRQRKWLLPIGVAAIAVSSAIVVSCFHDDDDPAVVGAAVDTFLPTEPDPLNVIGTSLYCEDATVVANPSTAAEGLFVDPLLVNSTPDMNISKDESNHNSGNNLKRMVPIVLSQDSAGAPVLDPVTNAQFEVHPLIVSFGEQVIGGYEGGDGSADIGDPDNVDDIFTALSMDNGKTWKKVKVGDTADKHSTMVSWQNQKIDYPGHSHKPTMQVEGNTILVAWNDKYCPTGDPFDLVDDATQELIDPEQPDYYKVNGSQGSIDYEGVLAPNNKFLYEVPFSCVWTARGVFRDHDADGVYEIEWRQAQQMTSGTRDSNKIWIASEDVGYAIAWQEDTEGLRSGKGLGPGEGYSGATTNHGTDLWYTHITLDDFDDVCAEADLECDVANAVDDPVAIAAFTTKPKPAINFTYPVRITNNETCTTVADGETKLYCEDNCDSTVAITTGNQSGTSINRCVQNDLDYMTPDATIAPAAAVLDGDTGASRPALKILKTNAPEPEFVTILAYEETKGLSESDPQDQGTVDTDIALEGKAVYLESFFWDQPVTVSAGRVVNLRVPQADVADDGTVTLTGLDIYENARRVVIMNQVDACEMSDGNPTFALMYKQGFATQGGPSDMFIRVNTGFVYNDFALLDNREVTNISAHDNAEINGDGQVIWDTTYLDHQSYTSPLDNTFSPRGWLRAGEVYTGFEFSPLWRATSTGTVPNNFWIHRFVDSVWKGPMQLSIVTGAKISTLDPRFIPTPIGRITSLPSDQSNPNVLFLAYGTFDMASGEEIGLHYSRSTDKGATWEYTDGGDPAAVVVTDAGLDGIPGTADDPAVHVAKLADRDAVHEMEVQGLGSPDGTMLFNAWLQETATLCADPWCGLDSRFGLVNYDTP